MSDLPTSRSAKDPSLGPLLRSVGLELLIYTPLVTAYLVVVLHFAPRLFTELFHQSLTAYSVVTLLVIVGQGVLLEILTSWLLRRFGLRS